MKKKKVAILMATYQGEAYLKEQLDSIFCQTYDAFTLIVRDDCSGDGTAQILNEYQTQHENMVILDNGGKNLGAKDNFYSLIQYAAQQDFDYYALSDQDDFWEEKKVEQAVFHMEQMTQQYGCEVPLLYCGAKTIVDEQLNALYIETVHAPKITWGSSMVENLCTGCTCMVNARLIEMAAKKKPEFYIMHDWWMYMIAVAFGYVYYDENAWIQYRQHGGNTYGEIISKRALFQYRIKELFRERGETYRQIANFIAIYELEDKKRNLATRLIESQKSKKLRWQLYRSGKIYRQRKKDNRIVSFLLLTGKL